MNFTELIHKALHGKHYRVKARVYVPPKYKRDAKGRFIGGFARKAYWRSVYDRDAPMVSNTELMVENIKAHNALFARLQSTGFSASGSIS